MDAGVVGTGVVGAGVVGVGVVSAGVVPQAASAPSNRTVNRTIATIRFIYLLSNFVIEHGKQTLPNRKTARELISRNDTGLPLWGVIPYQTFSAHLEPIPE